MKIKSEADVRDWVRANFARAYWIEPGSGGSTGFPDVLLPINGRLVPVELKEQAMISPGLWKPLAPDNNGGTRAMQRRVARNLAFDGVITHYLIGCSKSNTLWAYRYGEGITNEYVECWNVPNAVELTRILGGGR